MLTNEDPGVGGRQPHPGVRSSLFFQTYTLAELIVQNLCEVRYGENQAGRGTRSTRQISSSMPVQNRSCFLVGSSLALFSVCLRGTWFLFQESTDEGGGHELGQRGGRGWGAGPQEGKPPGLQRATCAVEAFTTAAHTCSWPSSSFVERGHPST